MSQKTRVAKGIGILHKGTGQLLLIGQPRDFEERLAMLLPNVNVVPTRDFQHACSLGKPERLDVILFEVGALGQTPPQVLHQLATPGTVWAATQRTSERPDFRQTYALDVQRVFTGLVEPEQVARQLSSLLRTGTLSIGLSDKKAAHQVRHAELLQIFLARSRSRLGAMLAAVASDQVEALRQVLVIDAHRMVGTLGTFGYPQGTELARKLETLLSKEEPLSARELADLESSARSILQLLADENEQVLVPQQSSGPTVCLLSPNDFLRMEFSARAPEFGFRAIAPPMSEFSELLTSSHQFDMAVFDFGESLPDPSGALKDVVQGVNCRVVAVCPPLNLQQRFDLSKLSLDTVVEGPLDTKSLASLVGKRLRTPAGSRIVALDDDQVYLSKLETVLAPLDLTLQATDSPEALWMALEARKPDMVILDVNMPRYDGLQVCRAIKTNPRFENVPVLFVSSRSESTVRAEAFAVGGDDFLDKSSSPQELRVRVISRLRRANAGKEQEVDELTGLLVASNALKRLEFMLSLAALRTLPVAIASINLDHFKPINDKHGRILGNQVLSRLASLLRGTLRDEDVIARWGGDEFVVGMFVTDKEQAKAKIDEVLAKIQAEPFQADGHPEIRVSFSAGISEHPQDGATFDELYRTAARALSMAKLHGRARVVPATAAKKLSEPVDVIIVEDDHPLGAVLVDALESQGLNVVWFQNVKEAREAMLSDAPYLTCKVMLLDKGLGVDDGLALIREIKDAGRMGSTYIVTCSARMSDQEVQMGFDLGTSDHISKPFSMPAVLRVIHRGLEHHRYRGL